MDFADLSLPRSDAKHATLPPAGERVVVHCQGFTCLAYRDAKGKWRTAKDDSELPEVLEVIFRF